jgi:hypothetical protein
MDNEDSLPHAQEYAIELSPNLVECSPYRHPISIWSNIVLYYFPSASSSSKFSLLLRCSE